MSALLTLAKSLGIDPGPLNQADLQEQTCSRATEGINTLKTEVKMLQNVTEAHQQYIYELAAKVERLRSEFPLFDDDGLCEHEHHCEFTLLQERKRLHGMLSETPPIALAALKAQWQAEAFDYPVVEASMKAGCIGEFSFAVKGAGICPVCAEDGLDRDCETCNGDYVVDLSVEVPWDIQKAIFKSMCKYKADAIRQRAQEAGDENNE